MPNELEDRLAEMAGLVPEPPPDATARARAAALAAGGAPQAGQRRALRALRRPARALTAIAGVAAVVALLAVLLIATPSHEPAPGGSGLRPDLSSLGAVAECAEPRLRVPCVEGAAPARQGIEALAGAPWLYRLPGGEPADLDDSAPRPSLVFPAGTTYGQALDALVVSVTLTGRLPAGTSLGAPLPDGAVLLQPADPDEAIAIDLRAPLGYGPGRGRVVGVTLSGPTGTAGGEGARTVWPRGTSIAVPQLPPCMVVRERGTGPVACGADEQPVLRGPDPGVSPLPEVAWADAPHPPAGPPTAADRRPAPADLRLPHLRADGRDAGALSTRDLRGRVVVLSFMASWCEPCSTQAPALEDLSARFDGPGAADVVVLGVMVNDRREPARAYLRTHHPALPALFDSGRTARRALGVAAVPETVLLDRRGRVALRIPGPIGPGTLTAALDALVAAAP